jgi:hypothetical protein
MVQKGLRSTEDVMNMLEVPRSIVRQTLPGIP